MIDGWELLFKLTPLQRKLHHELMGILWTTCVLSGTMVGPRCSIYPALLRAQDQVERTPFGPDPHGIFTNDISTPVAPLGELLVISLD